MCTRTMLLAAAAILCAPAVRGQSLVIEAEKASIRTEGGPAAGGGWNLWSNGRVGQPVRIRTSGTYDIIVRAWGSPAAGVWPEMALLIDGEAVETRSVDRDERADFRFTADLAAGVYEIAMAFLNDAVVGDEDRNLYLDRLEVIPPAHARTPSLASIGNLAEAGEQREQEVLAATASAFTRYRQADALIRVLNAAGQPIAGAEVSVEQTGHEFLFGCNIYSFDRYPDQWKNDAYKQRFQELFNYATVGFYWRWYEPRRGQPNYAYTDQIVRWCRERGIRLKGHPLLWDCEAGTPPWSPGQPAPEIQRQRVLDIMRRYQGQIEFWEVVNEPAHLPNMKIDDPYRWAREADPDAYLIVNDYHVLADGCPAFFRLLTDAKSRDVPFDGIGIQAHEPRTMRFPLDRVNRILDQYAALGKELHITEFTPTSSGQKITGSHLDGIWDEQAQADYAVKFYRVCFAHPAVRAITWWDLCDRGSWLPGGGMLRADLSPKPVYDELRRLIHEEWRTNAAGTTDEAGRFAFRGFLGQYRLVVAHAGVTSTAVFDVGRDDAEERTIQLPLGAGS
jgi:endo-1,4-beta-xylanase